MVGNVSGGRDTCGNRHTIDYRQKRGISRKQVQETVSGNHLVRTKCRRRGLRRTASPSSCSTGSTCCRRGLRRRCFSLDRWIAAQPHSKDAG
ncbi:hypothetical protein PHSY_005419 [Pseudozyma hubeiensis SY62]|uniref:Uncharacterized protein n=1 Tax=Pseudozyma hubeiensis (strain SY62) TaxID=1305764 RepID=R9P906_PSEHS|nr:hypothetical protein PHSY_005419 [Pseudozyma hubeiensis SY62]GAC97831.1 hypothetical protein PHSY_005419 [Pseudozyma hubeiensis SY62]